MLIFKTIAIANGLVVPIERLEVFVTEREAITRLKQGDIHGLELLVKQHQVKAVRTAYLITQDRSMAEDVVQACFHQGLSSHSAI